MVNDTSKFWTSKTGSISTNAVSAILTSTAINISTKIISAMLALATTTIFQYNIVQTKIETSNMADSIR